MSVVSVSLLPESDRKDIVSSFCLKFVILTVKAELDQLVEGLKILNLIQQSLFIHEDVPLNGDTLYDMFRCELSNYMSNQRDVEEAQLLNCLFIIAIMFSNASIDPNVRGRCYQCVQFSLCPDTRMQQETLIANPQL